MNIYISHASKYNYKDRLYEPIKKLALSKKHNFFLPHENKNLIIKTKDIIANSDLVIAEVSLPATGQGIELGWAEHFKIDIVCIYEKGASISSSLKFVTNQFIEYENIEDMIAKINDYIKNNDK